MIDLRSLVDLVPSSTRKMSAWTLFLFSVVRFSCYAGQDDDGRLTQIGLSVGVYVYEISLTFIQWET